MKYSIQLQKNPIEESVRARYAMIIPILRGMLYSTKADVVKECGGFDKITFEVFSRIYNEHPGDYGICFEYAVHAAIRSRDKNIHPYVSNVLNDYCRIKDSAESILFAIEKSGQSYVMESNSGLINRESRILVGSTGQPAKLQKHMSNIVKAFRNPKHAEKLPLSIRGIWKADLFIGGPHTHQWVGTTLKVRKEDLESASGLRIAMYPEPSNRESPKLDEERNLVLCPLPYGGEFMQLFGASFQILKQIIHSRGVQPSRVQLVYEDDQIVAKWLVDRKQFPVLEIIQALEPIQQKDLIEQRVEEVPSSKSNVEMVAPIAIVRE